MTASTGQCAYDTVEAWHRSLVCQWTDTSCTNCQGDWPETLQCQDLTFVLPGPSSKTRFLMLDLFAVCWWNDEMMKCVELLHFYVFQCVPCDYFVFHSKHIIKCLGRRSLLQIASKLHDQHHHPRLRFFVRIKASKHQTELCAGRQTLTQAWATEL